MAHGVDPAVKWVQPARPDPERDGPPADPGVQQLRPGDHTVLALRKPRDDRIGPKVANFGTYTVLNLATLAHAPDHAAKTATEHPPSKPI